MATCHSPDSSVTHMLTFHIIYLPDTVRYLYFFIESLLHHSDCDFCLVSNHCTAEEKQFLTQACQNDPRLTFRDLPTGTAPWPHGKALTHLYQQSDTEQFCFMDSDIFATGPFMQEFSPYMQGHACVSSCSSLWATPSDKTLASYIKVMPGRFNYTEDGLLLGSSYFAIYQRKQVDAVRSLYNIDFRKSKWHDLDQSIQHKLEEMGLRKERYDTAKVINLALQAQKGTLYFKETTHLVHLGSISAVTLHKIFLKKKWLADWILRLPHSKLQFNLLRKTAAPYVNILDTHMLTDTEIAQVTQQTINRHVRKSLVSRYFIHLLIALINQGPKPRIPVLDHKGVQGQIQQATQQLISLFDRLDETGHVPH